MYDPQGITVTQLLNLTHTTQTLFQASIMKETALLSNHTQSVFSIEQLHGLLRNSQALIQLIDLDRGWNYPQFSVSLCQQPAWTHVSFHVIQPYCCPCSLIMVLPLPLYRLGAIAVRAVSITVLSPSLSSLRSSRYGCKKGDADTVRNKQQGGSRRSVGDGGVHVVVAWYSRWLFWFLSMCFILICESGCILIKLDSQEIIMNRETKS